MVCPSLCLSTPSHIYAENSLSKPHKDLAFPSNISPNKRTEEARTEKQCNKAPVRYDFQVLLEDDDTVHTLMDSWVYLTIESESSDEECEDIGLTTNETQTMQDESPPILSSPEASQTLPFTTTSGETQLMEDELPTLVLSPHTSQIVPLAATSGESPVRHDEPPSSVSPHTSPTSPFTSTSRETKPTQDELPTLVLSPHTSQTLPLAATSGESAVRHDEPPSPISPHTSQTFPFTSTSQETQATQDELPTLVSSPHTSQTLPLGATSGESAVRNDEPPSPISPHTSQTSPFTSTSQETQLTQDELPMLGSSPHTSQTLLLGATSGESAVRHDEPPAPISPHISQTFPFTSTPQESQVMQKKLAPTNTRDSKANSFHTSSPCITTHKLKEENLNETHTNAFKATLSEGIHSKNSVVSSSLVNAKRKLPDEEIVICISDDESSSDLDVVCLDADKYSKPFYVCKDSSHKRASQKKCDGPLYISQNSSHPGDISVVKDIRPRKTMKSKMGSINNDKPDIIIERVISHKFTSGIVNVLPPSQPIIDKFGRKKGPRSTFVN